MNNIIKANFAPAKEVKADEKKADERAEFRKRAIESIGGSMVFVEDRLLYWDCENEWDLYR